jgi:hypothetical protein
VRFGAWDPLVPMPGTVAVVRLACPLPRSVRACAQHERKLGVDKR